jgi:hypothetical protein
MRAKLWEGQTLVSPRWLRTAGLLALLCAVAVLPALWGSQRIPDEAPEHEIKAGFLFRFLFFVRWPQMPAAGSTNMTAIGIVGRDPITEAFGDVEGKPIGTTGRQLVIRRFGSYRDGLDFSSCQILFVAASERQRYQQILSNPSLGSAPVLTVGDGEGFLDAGGMVRFIKKDESVRWRINLTPAERAGLELDLQLLRLADKVIRGPDCAEAAAVTRSDQEME